VQPTLHSDMINVEFSVCTQVALADMNTLTEPRRADPSCLDHQQQANVLNEVPGMAAGPAVC
jgi:hypothetical protein